MANSVFGTNFAEGQSFHRPPLFKGDNYLYWKTRMTLFLKSTDFTTWLIVKNGDHIPLKKVDGIDVPKLDEDMNEIDHRLLQQNAKALNIIFCALDVDVFNKVSACDTAKEAWDKLEVTYEGTNQVKENKISLLTHEYELFSMHAHEDISAMFSRFTNILNALKSLGKVYSNAEIVRKVLRSLPSSWDAKVTAIQEAKDLTQLNLDELLGSLMTHELYIKNRLEKEPNSLAFTSKMDNDDSDESDESDNEDMVIMVRKLKKFLRKKKSSNSSKEDKQMGDYSRKKNPVTCYECKGIGHYKSECPNLKKENNLKIKNEKKKAFKAVACDNFDSSDSEEESNDGEIANMCFMATTNEVNTNSQSPSSYELEISYNELEENFIMLLNAYDSLKEKSRKLKKDSKLLFEENSYLKNENESLQEKLLFVLDSQKESNEIIEKTQESSSTFLVKENEILKEKVDNLNSTLNKFTTSTETLNKIIGSQRCSFNKAGLGFTSNEKLYKNFFTNEKKIHDCKTCGRLYKVSHLCPLKKKYYDNNGNVFIKVWVQKGTKISFTNLSGPKPKWVPKVFR